MRHIRHILALAILLLGLFAPRSSFAAYTCTVTTTSFFAADGERYVQVVLAETEARDTSECAVTGLEDFGTVVSYRADRTAGTGTTINPIVGLATGVVATTINQVWVSSTTADFVTFQDFVFVYYSSTGTLYVRSRVNNVATDHSISTNILIRY